MSLTLTSKARECILVGDPGNPLGVIEVHRIVIVPGRAPKVVLRFAFDRSVEINRECVAKAKLESRQRQKEGESCNESNPPTA